jgi:hypothetical protein
VTVLTKEDHLVNSDRFEEAGDTIKANLIRHAMEGDFSKTYPYWLMIFGFNHITSINEVFGHSMVPDFPYHWDREVGNLGGGDNYSAIDKLIQFVERNRDVLQEFEEKTSKKREKEAAERAREREFQRRAKEGDVSAALASSEIRSCILGSMGLRRKYFPSPTSYVSRKVLKAAKEILHARYLRREDRRVAHNAAHLSCDRVRQDWLKKLHIKATLIGEDYHEKVAPLYRSKYAEVLYGRGGQEMSSRERYSKKYHNRFGPATCLAGGARLDNEINPTCVILESYRGTEVARIPLK